MSLYHQIMFQDAASAIMENMIMFYDYSMLIIMMIIIFISYILMFMMKNKFINLYLMENQMIEMIWTLIPVLFLIFLAIPSLKLLYLTDELVKPMFTFKVIGHQWFWEYEYGMKFMNKKIKDDCLIYESIMSNFESVSQFRLLDVSKNFILPLSCDIRLLILSDDVIHSFTVPSLGFKIDAVPGRLNQISVFINRAGLFYGQCSEICGVNHSFMPIVIETMPLSKFIKQMIGQNE